MKPFCKSNSFLIHLNRFKYIASSRFSHRQCQWESSAGSLICCISSSEGLLQQDMFKCSQDNSAGYIFFCIMIRTWPNSSKFPLSPTAPTPSPSNCNPPPRTTSNDRGKCSAFPFRNLAFIRCVHAACEE